MTPYMLLLGCVCTADAPQRPNIVVLLCDDLGYGDLECYGHPHIKTPNLNQLAATGIRLTDCYSAAPVCSPSRVGLLTGRSPNRAGVYDWIPAASKEPRPDAREQVHMRRQEATIAQLLKQAGYATCHAGKWHCNSRFNQPEQPQPHDFGFDHWFSTQNNAAPSHENPQNYVRNGKLVGPLDGFSCQLAVDEVIRWLDGRDEPTQEKPFFVYLAFHEPHEPVASPAELVARYAIVARSPDEAQYFANVTNVDLAVGRVIEALRARQLRENTLVIFTSDNGPETLNRYRGSQRSFGVPGPLRGMKLHTHEAGFRVAGIMNWPGRIPTPKVVRTPVSSLDFLPTFCKLAGIDSPANRSLDGTDFLPALSGQPLERDQPLIWCYFNAINEARVAMRHGQWKVLARLDHGQFPRIQNVIPQTDRTVKSVQLTDFEIYDLMLDTGEQENVANSSEQADQLKALLVTQFSELVRDSHVWIPTASGRSTDDTESNNAKGQRG